MCKNINSTKETHYLFVKGKEVPVTKEVYKAYVSASGKFGYEYKKAKRYGVKIVSLNETLEKGVEFSDPTTCTEDSIVENIDLRNAVSKLTMLEQQIIAKCYFELKPIREIAAELDIPRENIRRYKLVILAKLKKYLQNNQY